MSKQVWRIHEYSSTITTDANRFNEIFRANFETSYAMRNKLNEGSILNNLVGVSTTALSLLLGRAGITSGSVAASIAGVITSQSNYELDAQQRVIDNGAFAVLTLTEWLENRPQYRQAEVLFNFLEYEYYDGSRARFVQGDSYVIQRLQIDSGEWIIT